VVFPLCFSRYLCCDAFYRFGKTDETWVSVFDSFKGLPDSLLQAIRVVGSSTVQFVLKPFAVFPNAIELQ